MPAKLAVVEDVKDDKPKRARTVQRRNPQERWFAGICFLLLLIIAGLMWKSQSVDAAQIAELEGKLDYVYVEPIVERILLSNKNNKRLHENKDFLKRVVRIAVHEAYKEEPRIPVQVILDMLKIESRYNPVAINTTSGATGIGQVMPGVHAARLMREGVITESWLELHDPDVGVVAAVNVLRKYMRWTNGDLDASLRLYGGFGNRPKDDPQARNYVARALGA